MVDITTTISEIFKQKTVVIVGDLVADQFLNGTISRVSREAPVFILRHDTTNTVPGAAANTAVNVASLGANPILIGLTGADFNGDLLRKSLKIAGLDCSGIVSDRAFSTITKIRVLAGQHYAARQQVIRIDYENSASISEDTKSLLRERLAVAAKHADAIIISDYNYGAVFSEIYADALAIANRRTIPLIVDSRYRLRKFANATTISSIVAVRVEPVLTPLTMIEKTRRSPVAVVTYPVSAETWSIVPVFPRTLFAAIVPTKRFFRVPSTPPIVNESRHTWAFGLRARYE